MAMREKSYMLSIMRPIPRVYPAWPRPRSRRDFFSFPCYISPGTGRDVEASRPAAYHPANCAQFSSCTEAW